MGRYRWRTRVRSRLPWFLLDRGVAAKGRRDCGEHDWYNANGGVERCYHCALGERPYDPAHFLPPVANSPPPRIRLGRRTRREKLLGDCLAEQRKRREPCD